MKGTLSALVVSVAAVAAAQPEGMQPADQYRLRSVTEVAVSPDGNAVLYTESDASGVGRPTSRLLLYDRKSGASRVFRQSGEAGSQAVWSPDGSKVALLGAHEGRFGLVVTDARGAAEQWVAAVVGTNHPLPSLGPEAVLGAGLGLHRIPHRGPRARVG